jgi:uncharacterized membrane protein (UPF0127 family)
MTFVLATSGSLTAQEPVIPYVPPRPANTLVMLPDGSTVHVELATTEKERNYGLMGRTRLPEGRGMLFVHEQPGHYAYWMYHCKIALDILWMNQDHQIVEMSARTPPCTGEANTCPSYGGKQASIYVLELPAGDIAKHRLTVGETINFQLPSGNSDSASIQDQSTVPESGSSLTSRAHK